MQNANGTTEKYYPLQMTTYDEPVEVYIYILGQNIKAVYCSSSRLRARELCEQLLLYIV